MEVVGEHDVEGLADDQVVPGAHLHRSARRPCVEMHPPRGSCVGRSSFGGPGSMAVLPIAPRSLNARSVMLLNPRTYAHGW